MMKIFLSLACAIAISAASEQLVVVLSDEINATSGTLQRYEKRWVWKKIGDAVAVTLGRSGMGYAFGGNPLKQEGDGRSPAGLFAIGATFGYDPSPNAAMPYLHADERLVCVDDANDSRYNKIVSIRNGELLPKSFEWMRREDELYRNGAVIAYNETGEKGRGSCIFIHLNHPDRHPTSGCTALDESNLKELIGWLDDSKKPLILQLPKSECLKYEKEFEGIDCH